MSVEVHVHVHQARVKEPRPRRKYWRLGDVFARTQSANEAEQ